MKKSQTDQMQIGSPLVAEILIKLKGQEREGGDVVYISSQQQQFWIHVKA